MKEFYRDRADYKAVGKSFPKKDAMQLLLGEPVYMDDVVPNDCLCIKLLRSPHAHAIVKTVDASKALLVPGMVAVYSYKDVPNNRFTTAGQSFPEPSPHDRLILDSHVRFVGDPVAIVVGENEKCVEKALKLIKVDYEVLEPVLDFHKAKDNKVIVHPEEDWSDAFKTGDPKRNLIHHEGYTRGDIDKVFADCDITLERTYHTKANHQGYMETFRSYCQIDSKGRLHCISSTQIVFHVRRIIADALGIPKSMVRAEKLRIGGGFGAKQTVGNEIYAAFVTWTTKRPSKIIYTRQECMTAGSPRHEMEIKVKIGANLDGKIRALDVQSLSNGGAYGEHSTTTIGLSGHKTIPLYTGGCEAARFDADAVYTNVQSSGAYRGFGATQGCFAVESIVNELAEKINMDPMALRLKNIVKEGMVMPDYFDEVTSSCALDRCILHCSEKFDWENRFPVRTMPNGKIRSAGMAISMQGSGISNVDVASCHIKLIDDGMYMMTIGAADMGTGCDTILAQMAAEVLECKLDDILVFGADTDISPYDSGSYASSTTYLTGMATTNAAKKLRENICEIGARVLQRSLEEVEFDGSKVYTLDGALEVSLKEISYDAQCNNTITVDIIETCSSKISPPPYSASMVEVEIDPETGKVDVIELVSVIDCGIPVNPNLAKVQAEGGVVQGIGMALSENITYDVAGRIAENNWMQYRMPTRVDAGKITIAFEHSYEPSAPFGVKSIGEIVINTATPCIAHAIARATGRWLHTAPFTPEKVLMALKGMAYEEQDKRCMEEAK